MESLRERLSSNERVLLWLAQGDEVPPRRPGPLGGDGGAGGDASTQVGIAAALGISRSRASRLVAALQRDGFVAEAPLRRPGLGRAVTAYRLSADGLREARLLRGRLAGRRLRVRRGGVAQELALAEALRAAPALAEWDALVASERGLVVDLDAPEPAEAKGPLRGEGRFRRELLEAPPPRPFAGRAEERRAVERWAASRSPLLVTEAPAGQGKSSLAAHVARTAALGRHVLWLRVTESLGPDALLGRLDAFLRALGRPGPALAAGDDGALLRGLGSRVGRLPLLLVLDDVQKASPALQPTLDALARAAAAHGTPKLWLLGREAVLPHDLLPEAERHALPPLSEAEADEMLRGLGVADGERPALVRDCSGNPLFLALAARSPQAPQRGADLRHYLLRELVPSLAPEEREVLEAVGALRAPVARATLARVDLDRPPALARLQQVHLLAEDGAGRLAVHDLVREALHGALPPQRRREVHARLAEAFRPRGDDWSGVGEHLHHLAQAGRRDEAVRWLLRNRSRFLEQAAALAGRAA